MRILIIGSQGFIGRNCENFFLKGKHEVYGCDIVDKSASNYFISPKDPNYDEVFKQVKPEVCINASGSADVGFSLKNPEVDYKLNVTNVRLMLDAILKYSPACKFLNFSSAAVYGNPKSLPVRESASVGPLSPYGKNKLESERLLKEYHVRHALPTCSMRVFSAYGTGLKKQFFWDIYQKSLKGRDITLFGTGNESRDFIFIDDLVRAIDCIIKGGKFNGEPMNVSSGVESSIKEVATEFLTALGDSFSIQFTGEEKPGDPKNWKADISLLKACGFTPFTTFKEGIKKYAEWLKDSE